MIMNNHHCEEINGGISPAKSKLKNLPDEPGVYLFKDNKLIAK